MSGSSGKRNISVKEDNESFAVWFVCFILVFFAIVLLWRYDRKLVVIPFSYYALPQAYLIRLLHGGRDSYLWLRALREATIDPRYANNVPLHFLSGACSFLALRLWWLYMGILFALGMVFNRGSGQSGQFSGVFHLTGYEYEPVWFLGRARLPGWASKWCAGQDKKRSGLVNSLVFRRLSRKKIDGKPGLLSTRVVRVRVAPSLIEYQSRYWRNMKPIAVWDPHDTVPLLEPDLRPEIWAYRHGIITRRAYQEIVARTVGSRALSPLSYDYIRAEDVLKRQVTNGGAWRGIAKAPAYLRALAVICHYNRHGGQKVAIEIAYACAEASVPLWRLRSDAGADLLKATQMKVNTSIDIILRGNSRDPRLPVGPLFTPKMATDVDEMLLPHHYIRTAMVSLLGQCGPHRPWGGGNAPVLQPALLNFIQPLDRVLFFALASVGGEKYLVEGMGVVQQYQNEWTFWTFVSGKIAETERDLLNKQERLEFDRRITKGPADLTATDALKAEIKTLERELDDWRNYRTNVPALNMKGALSYLEALIVHDRNIGLPV